MILEIALRHAKPGLKAQFEQAFCHAYIFVRPISKNLILPYEDVKFDD